jgi:hypothetical protein
MRLTRQDWRGTTAGWAPTSRGYWEVTVERAGTYEVALRFAPIPPDAAAHVRLAGESREAKPAPGATALTFTGLKLPAGDARLEAWVEREGVSLGVLDVEVKRVGD